MFSTGVSLTYETNSSLTASSWLIQLSNTTPHDLKQQELNHKHGFASDEEIERNITRLTQVAQGFNATLQPITHDTWQMSLNTLHVHFLEVVRQSLSRQQQQQAHEMNLLIHWLEYELFNKFNNRQQYIFNVDFNHCPRAYGLKQQFPVDEYGYFSPTLDFGYLHLHYIYLGRPFLELADANDMVAPRHHFKPQREFNATCGMSFSEPEDKHGQRLMFADYYASRGGRDFFGHSLNDPQMAIGFFRVAQLVNIHEYQTESQRIQLRNQIQHSHVIGWEIHHQNKGSI